MIKNYKYYLIDLDRTIWNFDKNSEHAISLLISQDRRLDDAIRAKEGEEHLHKFFMHYDIFNHKLWAEYEKGILSKDDLRWRRFYDSFLAYGMDDVALARQFGEDYLEQMVEESELMPGARQMLEHIRNIGGEMAIVSNGFKEVQYRKLRKAGIESYFSDVIVSEEAGYLKPHPGIFACALERLSGISPNTSPDKWRQAKKETLMIGDDPVNDIEGAQIFGIDQFFYNLKHAIGQYGATYEYSSLSPIFER